MQAGRIVRAHRSRAVARAVVLRSLGITHAGGYKEETLAVQGVTAN